MSKTTSLLHSLRIGSLSALVGSACIYGAETALFPATSYQPQFTIAHFQLDAERHTSGVPYTYGQLDAFLREAQEHIPRKATYLQSDAIEILRQIHRMIAARSSLVKAQDFLSRGLYTGVMDCDTRTSLYLAVADAFNLPMVAAVHLPDHVWIRWKFPSGSYINWETTQGMIAYDHEYERYLPDTWACSPRARTLIKRSTIAKEYSLERYAAWIARQAYSDARLLSANRRREARREIYRSLELYCTSRDARALPSLERRYMHTEAQVKLSNMAGKIVPFSKANISKKERARMKRQYSLPIIR